MARINKAAGTSTRPRPGIWLFEIPESYEGGGETWPGIETEKMEGRKTTIIRTKAGDEMWKVRYRCIDDHPDAPKGTTVFDNFVWGGKNGAGLKRINTLVESAKLDLDQYGDVDAQPEWFYGAQFKMDVALDDNGYLSPNGFAPFYFADAESVPGELTAKVRGSGKKVRKAAAAVVADVDVPF